LEYGIGRRRKDERRSFYILKMEYITMSKKNKQIKSLLLVFLSIGLLVSIISDLFRNPSKSDLFPPSQRQILNFKPKSSAIHAPIYIKDNNWSARCWICKIRQS
jgi:hypothetical protein